MGGACAPSAPASERPGTTSEALAFSAIKPVSQVWVAMAGALDVETQYLPQVVCCENGAAPPTALQAQAVMSRTYMYFSLANDGLGTQAKPFTGTQSDQAYHCAASVSQACKDAVTATQGIVTAFKNAGGSLVANASFFVDGPRAACLANKACTCPIPAATVAMTPMDHEPGCDCFTWASMGLANPAYVTYNWSHTGSNVTGSTLGSLSNESNRGCGSQNIQACLAFAGWSYFDQLRFFFGQDIALYHADGTPVDTSALDGGGPSPTDGDGGPSYYLGAAGSKPDGEGPGCGIGRRGHSEAASRTGERGASLALALALLLVRRRRG
jgi:hypothetical protein